MNTQNDFTFYFHDYETFGTHPALDRPSQFAGVRTDADFNIIDEPLTLYCRVADDYLPQPEAVLITGITPQKTVQDGICEAEFAKKIHAAFSTPQSCILGYNNIRFDDEVTRHLFYRNFYDPYAYSWQNKNSRWDLIDLVRACYALRPDGIEWPINENGLPSFKLEDLTKANQLEHAKAHDAMSDVYATIAIARLIKSAQPKLFQYFFELRNKNNVKTLIDTLNLTPLTHVSGMFGAARGNTSWIVPIEWHPTQQNAVIVCDLMGDVQSLITLDADEIKTRLYTKTDDLKENEQHIPLKLIHINKCPIVAPAKTLTAENAARLNISRETCLHHLQLIKENQGIIREKLIAVFNSNDYSAQTDVDAQLYQGFFTPSATAQMAIIRETAPAQLGELNLPFDDPRLKPLLFRYRARNYPKTLNAAEQAKWLHYKQEKFSDNVIRDYALQLEHFAALYQHDATKLDLLKSLYHYYQQLIN